MCSHAVHRYAYKATRTHQLLAAVVGVLSGGGAVWQKQKSTGPRTSSVNLNLDFVVQQCSFPLIAQLLEVIQTQACEKLSPQIKSRTSSMPACSPGRYMRVCECRSDNEEVGSGRDEFQLPRFALGYRCHSWTWHHRTQKNLTVLWSHGCWDLSHIHSTPGEKLTLSRSQALKEITRSDQNQGSYKTLPRGGMFVGCNQSL